MTFGYLKRAEFTKALGELFHNRVYHCSTEDIFGPTVYHNYHLAHDKIGRLRKKLKPPIRRPHQIWLSSPFFKSN